MSVISDRYRARMARLRANATRAVVAAQTDSATTFVPTVIPLVLDAQRAAVSLTDAYMSLDAGRFDGDTEPWGIDPERIIGVHARRGDFLEDVYGRNLKVAASSFAERMAREVNTDITLAERSTTFMHTAGDPRITGYRRVLGIGEHCALCVAAATRTYRSEDLRPIHDHCQCSTEAIYTTEPIGDRKALTELYAMANGRTDAKSLGAIRVDGVLAARIVNTPSLGPTLVAA